MASTALTANPLREGLRRTRRAHPVCMVIFGGTGDLAARKLMPSIYELERTGSMPHDYAVIAFAHTSRTDDVYRGLIKEGLDPIHAAYVYMQNFTSHFAEGVSHFPALKKWATFVARAEDDRMLRLTTATFKVGSTPAPSWHLQL